MPTEKYYLGFPASEELDQRFQAVMNHWDNKESSSMVPVMQACLEKFVPELIQSFLIETASILDLGNFANKLIHSTADIITKTSLMLIPKMLAKRENKDFEPSVAFTKDIYLSASCNDKGVTYIGSEIDAATYGRFEKTIAEIDAGRGAEAQSEIRALMPMVVDILIDGFMKRSINTVKRNFVMRKLADGAMATCRAAGHKVVNNVFKDLPPEHYPVVADFMRVRLVKAQR